MKQKYFCLAVCFLLVSITCAVTVNAQDTDIYLSNILQVVQKYVDSQKEQIVDFLSKEEITIEEFNGKTKPVNITSIISDYRVFPEKATVISDCRIISEILTSLQPDIMQEDREVLSIKRNNRKVKEFTEDVWARGNNYIDIFILFDKQNEQCFEYKFVGRGKIKERNVLAIEVKQKSIDIGRNDIDDAKSNDRGERMVGISWHSAYQGIVLIDAVTMEIVQLSRDGIDYILTYKTPPIIHPITGKVLPTIIYKEKKYIIFIQYEYDKVKIGDHFLTLPVTKTVKLFQDNGQLDTVYTYRYSDYKSFGVGTKIMFDEMEESSDQIENPGFVGGFLENH